MPIAAAQSAKRFPNTLSQSTFEDTASHPARVEVRLGELARTRSVSLVVCLDALQRPPCLGFGAKAQHALVRVKEATRTGPLGDHRSPAGEVAGTAIAEPARAQCNGDGLGDAELPARSGHVIA